MNRGEAEYAIEVLSVGCYYMFYHGKTDNMTKRGRG